MNKDIFISDIEIKEMPVNFENKYQLEIKLFDMDNNENEFHTSLMKEKEVINYKKDLYKILHAVNRLQAIHNPQTNTLSTILDENQKIVGLEMDNGIILKNEIRPFTV